VGVIGAGDTTMAFLVHHVSNIVATDNKSIAILCLLCALAAYFIKEYLAHPPMIIFVYPVLVACSILAHYGFNLFEVYANNRLDQWLMWTIMAAICGTIAGVGFITAVVMTKERLNS
jgi:tetrahydromethanopterin S-methyltransferase subunit E